jgi:uroporphyrinogen decarboxylase
MKFTAAIYEHSAKLINKTPWEVSRSSELLYQAHVKAFETYGHTPVVIGIDIYNLEAEAYGSVIKRVEDDSIPSIQTYYCSSMNEILNLAPFDPQKAGRVPIVLQVGKKVKNRCPNADVRIPVSGPFSIASNILGFDNLLTEALLYPDRMRETLLHLASGQIRFCEEIINNGLDISFFESAATPPLISPDLFKAIEFPALMETIKGATAVVGHPVPCIIGGDTVHILDMILQTGTDYVICPAETNQALFMKKMQQHLNIMVRINTKPQVMMVDDLDLVYRDIDRVLEIAGNRENFVIGTGALPLEARTENVLAARDYVAKKLGI